MNMKTGKLTFKAARLAVKAYGFTLRKTPGEAEYRVGVGNEVGSYYTNDLQDAVDTAKLMRVELERMYL